MNVVHVNNAIETKTTQIQPFYALNFADSTSIYQILLYRTFDWMKSLSLLQQTLFATNIYADIRSMWKAT